MFSFVCVPSFLDTRLFRINVCPELLEVRWGGEGTRRLMSAHCNSYSLKNKDAQSYLTLRDPMTCCPPGSSAHEISQARTLKWIAISFSRGSSQQGYNPHLLWFLHCRQILYHWATRYVLRTSLSTKWDHMYIYIFFTYVFPGWIHQLIILEY